MSKQIDEGVVSMKFDANAFESGVARTLSALDKLKSGLQFKGSTKGLDDLEARSGRMKFDGITNGLQNVSDKFKAMSVVGIAALASLTTKAVDTGLQMAKSMAIQPIMDGFSEYELKMGSIQTILANTAKDGTKLKDVTASLDELNRYADKTIYNFGDMTKNIGLFTNAGIKLKDATSMIKGFSNEAAASGTTAQGAAGAAYQLSQALSSGKVTLMDWKSLTNVGMGNANMKKGIIDIATAMGTFKGKGVDANDAQKDFNKTLEKGWLTTDVMSTYLKIMAGDMSEAEMKSKGLSKAQIDAFKAQQKTSEDAATKVRTLTQLMGTLKEATGSGWTDTFDILFGNFDEATALFSNISDVLGKMVGDSAKARNDLLRGWKDIGGRKVLIDGLKAGFDALMTAIKPIKDAFRQIFPPATAEQLFVMTEHLRNFLQSLKMAPATAEKVKRTFAGFFAIFSIGMNLVRNFIRFLGTLFGQATEGSGAILDFTAKIGDWLVALDKSIKKGATFVKFFYNLSSVLAVPIAFLREIPSILSGIFSKGLKSDAVTSAFDRIGKRAEPLKTIFSGIADVWDKLKQKLAGAGKFFEPLAQGVYDLMQKLKVALTSGFTTGDFSGVLDAINTGLFGGLVLIFKKFMSNGINVDLGGGFLGKIGEAFDGLTGTLKSMQQQVKAETIQKIAIAVGILTASIVVLSLLDSAKLAQATGAVVGLFAGLVTAMKLLDQVSSFGGAVKLPLLAAGMTGLAIAVLLLSTAVKNLSGLDWNGLAKGLTGVMVLLGGIAGMMQLMPKDNGKMISAGLGMIAISVAIKILASAVKDMAGMDWGAMAKGLTGVSAMLGALGIFARFSEVNKMGISNGVGLILLAASLKIMYSVVKDFSGMDWGSMGKGMAGMAGALAIVAGAMRLMPTNMLVSAASLVIVALALKQIAAVMQTMGGMSWDEIAHGLVVLAGSLAIIAGAMYLMTGALPGAAALLVVAGALTVLVPVLQALGAMDIPTIATALGVLAGVFALLGVAGLVLAPVVLPLMGLGAAIMLMGAGAALAGVGLMAFSAGLTALSIAGTAGAAALTAIVAAIIGLIPLALTAFGQGLVALAGVIAGAGPTFVAAMTTLMMSLLQAINNVVPMVISTIINLISTILNAIASNIGNFVSLGMRIIVGFLNGIASQIGSVVRAAVNLIVNFINGIANNLQRVIDAGVNLIRKFMDGIAKAVPELVDSGAKAVIKLLNGIADAIRSNSKQLGDAGANVASAIIDGMVNGLTAIGGRVAAKAREIASNAISAFKGIFDIHSPSRVMYSIGQYVIKGFVNGMHGSRKSIDQEFGYLKGQLTNAVKSSQTDIDNAKKKLNSLYRARRKDWGAINATRSALAQATTEHQRFLNALNELNRQTGNKNRLDQLASQYESYTTRIKDAQTKLNDAVKLRDDYAKSVGDQFAGQKTTIGAETTLQSYFDETRKKIDSMNKMNWALHDLRALGLNDAMFKEFTAKGVDALPMMQELLAAGKSGVNQINQLSDYYDATAVGMGRNAARELYQAGVDSAAGLVKGLQNQQAAIQNQMNQIANGMVAAIKRQLGIHSPSRVFAEVGKFSMQGLAGGLETHGTLVEDATQNVGTRAIESMRKTIVGLDDIVAGGVDMQPVIRPVLDLTDVKKSAGAMDGLLSDARVTAQASYGQAKGASVGYAENNTPAVATTSSPTLEKPSVNYTQNIYSPKAVSTAETYRQTKNLISTMRGALPG